MKIGRVAGGAPTHNPPLRENAVCVSVGSAFFIFVLRHVTTPLTRFLTPQPASRLGSFPKTSSTKKGRPPDPIGIDPLLFTPSQFAPTLRSARPPITANPLRER
jgi:hypothetical protein